MATRRKNERWIATLLRALVFMLVLPLASLGALPFWAQLAGIEGPHVCHCSLEKHDCVCPKCNPDHDEMLFSSESLSGRCGDDEVAFGGKAIRAVLPAHGVLIAVVKRIAIAPPSVPVLPDVTLPPPTPPPRFSSSAV